MGRGRGATHAPCGNRRSHFRLESSRVVTTRAAIAPPDSRGAVRGWVGRRVGGLVSVNGGYAAPRGNRSGACRTLLPCAARVCMRQWRECEGERVRIHVRVHAWFHKWQQVARSNGGRCSGGWAAAGPARLGGGHAARW